MKKVVAVILAFSIAVMTVIGGYPSGLRSVEAAKINRYQLYYDDYAESITDRCVEFQGYLNNIGEKQYGLLFSLRILSQYGMYVHFMDKNYDKLGMYSKSVSMYEQNLRTEIDLFNERFGEKSKDYEALTLKATYTGVGSSQNQYGTHATAKKDLQVMLVDTIPQYINQMFKKVQDEITEAKGNVDKINRVKAKNTTLLTNVYNVYLYMMEAKSDLESFTPFGKNGKHITYTIKSENKTMESALAEALKGYDSLVQIAQKALANEQTDEDISVDLDLHYVDNLSDAVTKSTGVEVPESPNLSKLYYAIMAASAVYVPLQSYAGSSEFQVAVKELTNDDQAKKQIIEFYSAAKDLRKPLYKRELDDSGIPTGVAKLITIEDFFNDIDEGKSGALCSVLGQFKYNENSGTWMYYQDNSRTETGDKAGNISNNLDTSVNTSDSSDDWGDVTDDASEENEEAGDDEEEEGGNGERNAEGDAEESASIETILDSFFPAKKAAAKPISASPIPNQTTDDDEQEMGSSVDEESKDNQNGVGNDKAGSTVNSNAKLSDDEILENNAVAAYSEITDETKLTDAQYFYGCDYSRDIDNMTYSIMKNVLKSSSNLQYISDKSTRYLYINVFGDIVTDDNLVIFPGVANPMIYQESAKYNPYTAAFMNYYPAVYRASSYFKLTNKNGIGKYLVCKQTSNKSKGEEKIYSLKTESINSVKSTSPLINREFELEFTIDGSQKHELLQYRRLIFGASSEWTEKNVMYVYTPLIYGKSTQIGGVNIFPYVPTEDANFNVAKAIAKNMYWYLTVDDNTTDKRSVHRMHDNYVLHNFIISGAKGTNNPKGYSTNLLEQYTKYVENSQSRLLSKVMDLSKTLVNTLTKVQGVIGLRESLQSPILGRALIVCRQNLLLFLLIVSIALLTVFARMRIDRFQLVTKFLLCVGISYLSITILPTYLPVFFNMAINNLSEDLSYKVLAVQIEKDAIGEGNALLDEDGTLKINSDSITLYRAGTLNYQEFVNNVNVDESELAAGNAVVMNWESGLYAEGDSLKINTHKLYDTLKIAKDTSNETEKGDSGDISDVKISTADKGASNVYKLKAYKTVSNNVDYYNPFYQVVDSFVANINRFQEIANIPRSTITYSNGTSKDNFLVYSFVNSQVFLTPGTYTNDFEVKGLTSEEEEELLQEQAELANDFQRAFGKASEANDFLGLSTWLWEPTEAMKKTLWYKSMVKSGYYNVNTGEANEKKMNALIKKVNNVTKNFVYDMDTLIGQLSDETMIEVISTRAMVALCQEISDFGNWVYPFSLNYGDFSLKDVASSVFISSYEKYTTMNLDVVDYVGYKDGWFNLIVFDALIILLFVVVWIVQILVPVLYVLLCFALIIKLLAEGDGKIPLKGFAKCTLIIMACFTTLALGLVVTETTNGSVVCIYVMLAICLLILYVLFTVLSSIVANWTDLGNTIIGVNLKNAFDFRRLGSSVRNIRVSSFIANHASKGNKKHKDGWYNNYSDYRYGDYDEYSEYNAYRYDSPIEDLYDVGISNSADNSKIITEPDTDYEELPVPETMTDDYDDLSEILNVEKEDLNEDRF